MGGLLGKSPVFKVLLLLSGRHRRGDGRLRGHDVRRRGRVGRLPRGTHGPKISHG